MKDLCYGKIFPMSYAIYDVISNANLPNMDNLSQHMHDQLTAYASTRIYKQDRHRILYTFAGVTVALHLRWCIRLGS